MNMADTQFTIFYYSNTVEKTSSVGEGDYVVSQGAKNTPVYLTLQSFLEC